MPLFHDSSFIFYLFLRHVHSGIMLPRLIIYVPYLEFNVFKVIILPRFHIVRTRWPGNNLCERLKLEKMNR